MGTWKHNEKVYLLSAPKPNVVWNAKFSAKVQNLAGESEKWNYPRDNKTAFEPPPTW